jgi:hypothetical protein
LMGLLIVTFQLVALWMVVLMAMTSSPEVLCVAMYVEFATQSEHVHVPRLTTSLIQFPVLYSLGEIVLVLV